MQFLLPWSDPLATQDFDCNALMCAGQWGHLNCAQVLLGSSARDACAQCSQNGLTALMIAACMGRVECTQALLPHSDIAARDHAGLDALDWALNGEFKGQFVSDSTWNCAKLLAPLFNPSRVVDYIGHSPEDTFALAQSWLERKALAAAVGEAASGNESPPGHSTHSESSGPVSSPSRTLLRI